MESVKKWLSDRSVKRNGLYLHYSPPKSVSGAQLRQWARGGAESRLERAVLAGQGRRLLAEAEALPIAHHLPALMVKCSSLHTAVERGSLMELQELLESDYNRRKYIMCTDESGVGLLHKAIYYDYMDIAEWLVQIYPPIVHQRDSEGRTPLHYSAMCRDEAGAAALLEGAGAARGARDAAGRTPAHYRGPRPDLVLPTAATDMARDTKNHPPGGVIKRSNIRIWCHDCDMSRLQRVVWDGHGARLLSEVTNQPVVKKFFEAVPYIMNTIRELHTAVVQNDIENVMKHSGDPIPAVVLSSRDTNNMTVFHKAAGLGHGGILRYICERYPQGVNDVDNEGRTALHYAAAVKDDQHTYNTLVGLGADESVMDNKNKTPGYYINRSQEIDRSLFKVVPEAPRTPSSAYPSSWDWKLLDTEVIAELNKKSRRKGFKQSTENISSNNTLSENTENLGHMKTSSTQELIKDLPDLDDSSKSIKQMSDDNDRATNSKESEEAEEHKEPETIEEEPEITEENDEKEEEPDPAKNLDENDKPKIEEENDNADIIDNNEHKDDNEPEADVNSVGETENDGDKPNKDDESDHKSDSNNDAEVLQTSDKKSVKTEDGDEDKNSESTDVEEKDMAKEEDNCQDKENNKEDCDKQTIDEKPASPKTETGNKCDEALEKEEASGSLEKEEQEQGAESEKAQSEGNHNKCDDEDDDDVQIPGESQSEYSELNLASTTEATDSPSVKRGNQTNGRSTQESLIEGVINGDMDIDTEDASISERDISVHGESEVLIVDNEIDPEVTELINTINMEMLAALVLNGEGARLVGRHSSNTELEAFLQNVPAYMRKIHKVHMAAREGSIKELQSALDRRKFAIARDPISPNGATPLHVATIFGKTNIIKYLGGRFPETLSAVDFEGRTALHYAAILPDNGHYYNLLQQLGANSKDLDDNGHSAEEYYRKQNLMSLDQLFSDFGVTEDVMQDMLSDKGTNNTNGHMDIPIFRTEEGKYLAKSLGDPLIKGLTEVAHVKPKDPIAFLASFLHNFPDQEKPRLGTQESNLLVTHEAAEVENNAPAPPATTSMALRAKTSVKKPEKPIDVITVDPKPEPSPDAPEAAFSSVNRDEHGQSMLHFAAARSHTRNALFQLLQESDINLAYRDELYRTARDVSIQANVAENTIEIDRWVLHLAARDNSEKIMDLLLEGYDHILDVLDEEGVPIAEVIAQRGLNKMSSLLASIPAFEESRESLHAAIRRGDLASVQAAVAAEGGRTLARGKNSFGRSALHVAVLAQQEDLVSHLVDTCPELLRCGDNLERTPLHYAMGIDKIESISRVLIRAGAKRVLKDLKGRQPSYYFMNKSDILRLKEEEEVY